MNIPPTGQSGKKDPSPQANRPLPQANTPPMPDWVEGLRRLYGAVENEPLPESFAKVLRQIDRSSKD